MGLYDTFEGRCPSCPSDFHIQTKLFGRVMKTFRLGSRVPNGNKSDRIGLKESCPGCGSHLVAVIEEGILIRFDHDLPMSAEGIWGKRCKDWEEAVENTEQFRADLLKVGRMDSICQAIHEIRSRFKMETGIEPKFLVIGDLFLLPLVQELRDSGSYPKLSPSASIESYAGLKVVRVKAEVIEMGY